MEYILEQPFEKRKYPRTSLEIQVIMKPADDDFMLFGWLQDISHAGFKVKIDFPLPLKDIFHKGDEISFETYEDFFGLRGLGEIRWTSTEGNEAGIRFSELDCESRKVLEDFLEMCL